MFTRPLRFQTLPSTYNTLKHYHAHQLFDEIPKPNNNVSIHSSMKASMNQNQPYKALQILKQHIHHDGTVSVDEVCIAIALKAFPYDVRIGSQIHAFAVSSGLNLFLTVSNGLMNLYCKSGFFDLAFGIFQKLRDPDTVSWNTIIKGCDKVDNAVELTLRMHGTGVRFDERTYSTVLAFCSNRYELVSLGVQVHSLIVKSGFEMDTYIGNALITLYSRWEKFVEAEKVFDEMPHRDLVSWNAMISGYTQEGKDAFEGIRLFVDMVREGIKLDHVSFSSVVGACVHERNIGVGRQIHCSIVKTGHEKHLSVCNVLISMYSKCDVVSDANKVFYGMDERNVISWTTMISIQEEDALSLFCKMRSDGVYPNEVTFISLIHAMVVKNSLREGEMIHGFCRKTGFVSELVVANSLLTMYTKFEEMEESKKVFDELKQRGLISWNALISGYAQNQLYREALETYFLALLECTPNTYTFGSVLNAIASAESISLTHGKRCHSRIVKLGLNTDPIVSGVLLDMYAKRGSIDESGRVFEEIPEKSLVAWTAIISAYARHGDCEAVMTLLNRMEIEKVKPDLITFLAVLSSCSRGGLLDMGRSIFYSMVNDHNLEPSPEHYSCMVDMLGRAGRLKEAEKFLQQMPGKPGLSALQSLLGACKMYGNVDMGIRVGELLMDMEPTESGSYVLMSNMYAEKGEWENVAKIRMKMRSRGVKKEIGFSWADIGGYADGYMHGFSSDDQSHPKTEEIYNMVECLGSAMTSLKRGQIEHLLCDP